MAQQVKAVAALLQSGTEGGIVRTLTLQSDPVCFVTQLVGSATIRAVHSITQVTPQLGKRLRIEGKIIGFFGMRDGGNAPKMQIIPDKAFKKEKVKVPPVETLTTDRAWASGDKEALFQQEAEHPAVEVCKLAPIPWD